MPEYRRECKLQRVTLNIHGYEKQYTTICGGRVGSINAALGFHFYRITLLQSARPFSSVLDLDLDNSRQEPEAITATSDCSSISVCI